MIESCIGSVCLSKELSYRENEITELGEKVCELNNKLDAMTCNRDVQEERTIKAEKDVERVRLKLERERRLLNESCEGHYNALVGRDGLRKKVKELEVELERMKKLYYSMEVRDHATDPR